MPDLARSRLRAILGAGCVAFSAVWLSSSLQDRATDTTRPAIFWTEQRLVEMLRDWRTGLKPGASAVGVFGASEVEAAVWPTTIDRATEAAGIASTTFNFGARSLTIGLVAFLDVFSRQARQTQQRFALSLVAYNASRMTENYRRYNFSRDQRKAFEAVLRADDLPLSWLFLDPRLLDLRFSRLIRARDFLTNSFYYAVADGLMTRPPGVSLFPFPERERLGVTTFQFWRDPSFSPYPAWDPATRGEFHWGMPASAAEFARAEADLTSPTGMAIMTEYQDRCCSILNPIPDPIMLREFDAGLAMLRSISDRLVIFHIPDSPRLRYPETVRRNLDETLQALSRRHGANLWELGGDPRLVETDYLDPGHLNQVGAAKLNRELGRRIVEALRGPAR